ncbi:MAG: thiol peroxidase, partial [Myxococcota bacterium]
MAEITLKGNPLKTVGELPAVGTFCPDVRATTLGLEDVSLQNFAGKRKVLNIFPSVDTPVCALSVKRFHKDAMAKNNVVVLNLSADLPFALKRFCGAEGLENVEALSTFRTDADDVLGVKMTTGPLAGLCARAVVILDENNNVLYTEQVPEIGQ